MNKKILLTIAPITLLIGALVGCNNDGNVRYAVTFDTDGGTLINPVVVKKGEKVSRPSETPSKDGYSFTDWYTTKDGDTKFDFGTAINQNTTVYAHYKALSEEEKFYEAYKTASENFQKSEKGFDQYDITYTVAGQEVTDIEKVYYGFDEENARECSLKQIGSEDELILAGGNMKYYEDTTKGIKANIQKLKDDGCTLTFNVDKQSYTCGFTATIGGVSISSTFNMYGYLTKGTLAGEGNVGIEFELKYSGEQHNPFKKVNATLNKGTYTASASNLVYRDLVRVIIDDTDITNNPFDTIECPGYLIDKTILKDICVKAIYNDNFTKVDEKNYTTDEGKITFTKAARNAKTIVDLKVMKQEGINSLTINAKKVTQ